MDVGIIGVGCKNILSVVTVTGTQEELNEWLRGEDG